MSISLGDAEYIQATSYVLVNSKKSSMRYSKLAVSFAACHHIILSDIGIGLTSPFTLVRRFSSQPRSVRRLDMSSH